MFDNSLAECLMTGIRADYKLLINHYFV